MKKAILILLSIALIGCLSACGSKVEDEDGGDGANMANPMTEYASLAELNEAASTDLVLPEGLEVTNESFATISTDNGIIAQYRFTYDGAEYTYRNAPGIFDEDISGVYINAEPAFTGQGDAEPAFNSDEETQVARWMNINGQFTLSTAADAITADKFAALAKKFAEYSIPTPTGDRLAAYYKDLEGRWQDKVSERAGLEVTAKADCATFLVSWASSASENTTWEMTVKLSEDGLLYYSDCKELNHIYDESGSETVEIVSTDGSGYFALGSEDGLLYWSGAADKSCAECVFERITV